jgi:hypothetical protein
MKFYLKQKVKREFATNKAVKKAICFAKDASTNNH